MAPAAEGRWVDVSPSQFTHEKGRLELVRKLPPDQQPFRAWLRDGRGRWHEVDLLVLARRQLHLIELKYFRGVSPSLIPEVESRGRGFPMCAGLHTLADCAIKSVVIWLAHGLFRVHPLFPVKYRYPLDGWVPVRP